MRRVAERPWLMVAAAGALDPQGPAARAAADLWWFMLALGAAVFALFLGLLVFGLVRRRDDPETGRLVRRWIVAGGVVLPFVVIVVVFGATLVAMRATPSTAGDDAVRVELVGHRFWYEIRYPDHDVVTANELHLPVGRETVVELVSADVIHSFWVPALGGKMDVMPERRNTLVLQADEPGEHRSRCAEFCGLQHARMGLIVVAEPAADFDAWLASHRDAVSEPAAPAARRGREVFVDAGCAACHAAPGIDATARGTVDAAPDLTTLGQRRTLGAAVLPNDRASFGDWVRDPEQFKLGVEMPATDLGEEELDALWSYLGGDG